MDTIHEAARDVPVVHECDVCVVGGSCTGVFAAVRAARLGASVVVIEKQNAFGGTATSGLVHIWHSLLNTEYDTTIIGGLTREVIDRLTRRDACAATGDSPDSAFLLNTEELKIELDALIVEEGVTPMLHAPFAAPLATDGRIDAVFVETKSGRAAVRARVFVDATGDGDLAARTGVPFRIGSPLQPPTMCAKIRGMEGVPIRDLYERCREEYDLPEDSGWNAPVPNTDDVRMYAETHVFGADCSDADALTAAEMEGRRHIRALMDMVRAHHPDRRDRLALLGLPSYIGIRETRRFEARYRLTEQDVLHGVRFDDAVAAGSYRVDVHNPSGGGFVFKYLDGRRVSVGGEGNVEDRWREETAENPTFYQIPYRSMTHASFPNLIMAGRMISTDAGAFGAIRVMVNCNQIGEAAGVAARLAVRDGVSVDEVDAHELRKLLELGGSVVL